MSAAFSTGTVLALAALHLMPSTSTQAKELSLAWDTLPQLPPAAGQAVQPGVAGPFAGVHRGALIVAGGANFPDKMPWEGGTKTWWADIWVCDLSAGSAGSWLEGIREKLPAPLGYGVSVSTPEGVVCAGGNDATRCHDAVFLLAWDPASRTVRRTGLPPMPEPLSMMAGACVGTTLYVAGGQHATTSPAPSSAFWALDLSKRGDAAAFRWQRLPTWPGPARVLPVAAAARGPEGDVLLLFSGRTPAAGRPTTLLNDAYAFDPATGRWRTLAPVGGGGGHCVMAGTAWTAPNGEVLVLGGDRGELFSVLERHDLAIAELKQQSAGATEDGRAALQRDIAAQLDAKRRIYDRHPGFGREIFAYDPRTDTWRCAGTAPLPPQVTSVAVPAPGGEAVLIPSGEIRPGVRTPSVIRLRSAQAP